MFDFLIISIFICLSFLFIVYFFAQRHGEARVARKLVLLCGKSKEYHSFSNVILKTLDGTTEIDHILISPHGIFVIETKDYKGWIFGKEHQRRWTQSLFSGAFGCSSIKYYFQNPIHQNYKHVKAIQKFLNVDLSFIFNVVVFVGDSKFKTEMPENVIGLNKLIPYIKSHTTTLFSGKKSKEFIQKLSDYIEHDSISKKDHIENIKKNMNNPVCPRCGKPMILRVAKKGKRIGSEFWGCPNFPSCRETKDVVK